MTLAEPDDLLAAELALGVLGREDDAAARDRAVAEPNFADAVHAWEMRLAPLLNDVVPVTPPASVLMALLRRITPPGAANDPLPALQRRVTLWRVAAGLATMVAAGLSILLVTRPVLQSPSEPTTPRPEIAVQAEPPLVALLGEGKSAPKVLASYDPQQHQLVLANTVALAAGAGRAHQLWVIPEKAKPVSLGILPAQARSHRQVPDELAGLIVSGATLAISVEPTGGSPTGQPTGAVIASGPLNRS